MWIELHDTLLDHRKMKRLSRSVTRQPVTVRGHLVTLWMNVLRHAPDGNLVDWTPSDIEDYAEWDGAPGELVEALVVCEFLDRKNGVISVHDWSEFATHIKAAQRKRNERERKKREADLAIAESQDVTGRHVTSQDGDRNSGRVTLNRTEPNRTEPEPARGGDVISTGAGLGNELRKHDVRLAIGAESAFGKYLPCTPAQVAEAVRVTVERTGEPKAAYALTVLDGLRRKPPDDGAPQKLKDPAEQQRLDETRDRRKARGKLGKDRIGLPATLLTAWDRKLDEIDPTQTELEQACDAVRKRSDSNNFQPYDWPEIIEELQQMRQAGAA